MKEIIQQGTPQRFRDTVVAARFCCPNCGCVFGAGAEDMNKETFYARGIEVETAYTSACPNCGMVASYDWALTLRTALELAPAKEAEHGQ